MFPIVIGDGVRFRESLAQLFYATGIETRRDMISCVSVGSFFIAQVRSSDFFGAPRWGVSPTRDEIMIVFDRCTNCLDDFFVVTVVVVVVVVRMLPLSRVA